MSPASTSTTRSGIGRANRIDDRRRARQSASRVGSAGVVVPAGQPTVDIRRRRNDEIERLGDEHPDFGLPAHDRRQRAASDQCERERSRRERREMLGSDIGERYCRPLDAAESASASAIDEPARPASLSR